MSYNCKSADDVLKTIKDDKIEMVDLRFADLPGLWQHFSVPPRRSTLVALPRASASMAPPFAAFKRSRKAT